MARKWKVSYNKDVNIGRVVTKVLVTIVALYAGGTVLTQLGTVINGTTSPFYQGLTLIGWTVSNGTVTATTGSGILAVVGIVAIASIVMEFVKIRMG